MKRLVSVLGIFLVGIVLIFLGWFFLEYQGIRKGMYKLAEVDGVGVDSTEFDLGDESKVELMAVKAVYLGGDQDLRFLSLDIDDRPVIFKVYTGGDIDEDFKIKMLVEADAAESFGIADFSSQQVGEKIKENGLVELYVIGGANISEKLKANDKTLEKITELTESQQEGIGIVLDRLESGEGNELMGWVKGFWGYRNIVLPIFMVDIYD